MESILLIGAGALASDLIDMFGPGRFAGAYVDPEYRRGDELDGVPVYSHWTQAAAVASHYLLAVSSIEHRERAMALAADAGLIAASPMVSPCARVARSAELERGCVVAHFSAVGPQARVAANGLLMHGVVLGHNSVLEANVVVCAGVSIGGYVEIGSRSFIGTNAVLAPKIHLGPDSFVAAGAACLRSAPARSLLIGNPARRMPVEQGMPSS
jgi:UDP-3-O-[3-hydroxymyristoyl] glucosamine N-acyltransferase